MFISPDIVIIHAFSDTHKQYIISNLISHDGRHYLIIDTDNDDAEGCMQVNVIFLNFFCSFSRTENT